MRRFCCRGCFGAALALDFGAVCCPGTNSAASACSCAGVMAAFACVSWPPNCLPSAVRRSAWFPRPPPRPLPRRDGPFRLALFDEVDSGVAWFAAGGWAEGATDAGLKFKDSEAVAPPLPRFEPLGRRGLDRGVDCVCEAGCAEASACMIAMFGAVKSKSVSSAVVLASFCERAFMQSSQQNVDRREETWVSRTFERCR